jgi:hypothetical protein
MTSLTNNQITALTATTRTTDELDSIIFEIQTTTSLSSEARNSLHACMTYAMPLGLSLLLVRTLIGTRIFLQLSK